MAGGGTDEDNPVPVNVVPLIDILMCLLLFYMCASKFAALEGRMDAFLPKDKGANAGPPPPKVLDEVRIRLSWENEAAVFKFGNRSVQDLNELQNLVVTQYTALVNGKRKEDPDPSVIIEATAQVPWRNVVEAMDLCRRNKIEKIEFAFTSDAAGMDLTTPAK